MDKSSPASTHKASESKFQRWFPALLALLLAVALGLFAAWKYGALPATHAVTGAAGTMNGQANAAAEGSGPTVAQFFSPGDDLESVWVSQVNAAQRSIHIACFGLSNTQIGEALASASHDRHVEVIIIEDNRQAKLPADLHNDLSAAGCHIVIKRSKVLLHDKLGVFDGEAAIIGSYNLSRSAEEQDNSAVVFEHDPVSAALDESAWERIFQRETGLSYNPGMNLPPIIPEKPL
ncbi:MAG: phospholipase D-like domain-containing protein [Armatimonadota bacterium]|nr:phospholipase D-like domain-containing protein [Armatimonadota bacterium]